MERYAHPVEDSNALGKAAALVPIRSRVLDVGTGRGTFARHLRDVRECRVWGCDSTAEWRVGDLFERWVCADLDTSDLASHFPNQTFDIIAFVDVLEHLRQPERAIASARTLLAPRGQLVASIPNIAHAAIIGALLDDEFTYRDEGLLDRTHIHFFTRRSVEALFASQGYVIDRLNRVEIAPEHTELQFNLAKLPPVVADFMRAKSEAFTYQFIISASVQG